MKGSLSLSWQTTPNKRLLSYKSNNMSASVWELDSSRWMYWWIVIQMCERRSDPASAQWQTDTLLKCLAAKRITVLPIKSLSHSTLCRTIIILIQLKIWTPLALRGLDLLWKFLISLWGPASGEMYPWWCQMIKNSMTTTDQFALKFGMDISSP